MNSYLPNTIVVLFFLMATSIAPLVYAVNNIYNCNGHLLFCAGGINVPNIILITIVSPLMGTFIGAGILLFNGPDKRKKKL